MFEAAVSTGRQTDRMGGRRLARGRYLDRVDGDDLVPASRPVDVTAVVVTHEAADVIGACLASLRAAADEVSLEVIVVDNASRDGTAGIVGREHPEVRLLRKTQRGGFAENCNIGAVAAAGRHLLLLNPDARLLPGSLRDLVEHLERRRGVGVAGPRLVYGDGRPQAGARRFPTVKATMVRRTPLRIVLRTSEAERRHLAPADATDAVTADWMLGAALLVRSDAFADVDGFDDGYRLYCEDIDLCWRMHERGWGVEYVPSIVVEHDLAETTRQRFLTVRTWWHLRSMARFVRLHGLPAPSTGARPVEAIPVGVAADG